jgi:hypothetical protein
VTINLALTRQAKILLPLRGSIQTRGVAEGDKGDANAALDPQTTVTLRTGIFVSKQPDLCLIANQTETPASHPGALVMATS